ncbi:siderophore-interacting protein [Blastococcus brunescens]|uniref:Siderophore-interacting protein n=1 Tax=Blastococcus brunescens TaxID=1564165 RepID=A0ABZ1B4T7_9ACTN|nr:siderophore-interacting protein [Blastococcus sp. BMG 8361]WRL65744.1 siderophore-interacting protein [Blastococcus sp. BMG 8361]
MTRTYTVRAWDAETGELTIDFVHHGDEGLAGPWAAAAQPGDVIQLMGPGGAYAPIRRPTGTCWPVTSPRCRPSRPPSPGCREPLGSWPSSRSPARRRSSPT